MEEYFFKMTKNLFELQRQIDKRMLHLSHGKKATPLFNEDSEEDGGEMKIGENEKLKNNGWHQISHIMEDMGKDQAKYLKTGINENIFEECKWIELNEDEKYWLQRELQIQKQKVDQNENELKKIVNETKALTKEFLNVIEETETLLKKYAKIECKNMTTDLRNARLQILAAATKYEP
uniref:Uncharacterized protein n=2 Tax=Panagrolaimus superbus TaxID=310955 RepID=A0A914ZAW8_9BILA